MKISAVLTKTESYDRLRAQSTAGKSESKNLQGDKKHSFD
jgi:hypothetical protein